MTLWLIIHYIHEIYIIILFFFNFVQRNTLFNASHHMSPLPAVMMLFSVTHTQSANGKKSPLIVAILHSLAAFTTLMLESWPTQASLFPEAEKLTPCTQPPAMKVETNQWTTNKLIDGLCHSGKSSCNLWKYPIFKVFPLTNRQICHSIRPMCQL